jgi:hypothetical protein
MLHSDEPKVPGTVNPVTSFELTHSDGWKIKGEMRNDWYSWVEKFEAEHPKYGEVWSDLEDRIVYASSESALSEFEKNHPFHQSDPKDAY